MNSSIILVDGANLVHRMHYVHKNLKNKQGVPTGAIYGFLKMLLFYSDKLNSRNFIICWEGEQQQNWRKQILEDYKLNRSKSKQDNSFVTIKESIIVLKTLTRLCGIFNVFRPGFESDDIIAYFVRKFRKNLKIISGDKDMFQFVNDKRKIRVVYPNVKFNQPYVMVNEKKVLELFGVYPNEMPILLSLTGDKTDNIQGINGIGSKKAKDIIEKAQNAKRVSSLHENERNKFISVNVGNLLKKEDKEIFNKNLRVIDLNYSPIHTMQLSQNNFIYSKKFFVKEVKEILNRLEIKSFGIFDLMRLFPNKQFQNRMLNLIQEG